MTVPLTCSDKPRPSVHKGAKGHQWWSRDVYHVQHSDMTTLCGRDCSDWLRMEPREAAEVLEDHHLCRRCADKLKIA